MISSIPGVGGSKGLAWGILDISSPWKHILLHVIINYMVEAEEEKVKTNSTINLFNCNETLLYSTI